MTLLCFLISQVTSGKLELHCYNLTKDCLEKLETESSQLGQWFTAKASLFTSIVTQKLGLFNNQVTSLNITKLSKDREISQQMLKE